MKLSHPCHRSLLFPVMMLHHNLDFPFFRAIFNLESCVFINWLTWFDDDCQSTSVISSGNYSINSSVHILLLLYFIVLMQQHHGI